MTTSAPSAVQNSAALPGTGEIRGFLVQLDATFHARVNIFLVAESLLLAALSQVWGGKELGIISVICAVGIAATCLLWRPLRVLAQRTRGIAQLLENDALYQQYITASQAPLNQTHRLANTIPTVFLVAWLVVAALAIARRCGVATFLYASGA